MNKQEEILSLLESNAKLSAAELAVMVGRPAAEVEQTIADLEANKTILGYNAVVNWERNHLQPPLRR